VSSKTEQPTETKLKNAAEKGDMAKSHPFSVALSMLAWWLALPTLMGLALAFFMSYADRLLSLQVLQDEPGTRMFFLSVMAAGMAIPAAMGITMALLLGVAQSRGKIARKRQWFDVNRVNPVSGLKNLFGLQRLFATALATASMMVVVFVSLLVGRSLLTTLAALPSSVRWQDVLLGSLAMGWKAVGYAVLGCACLGALDWIVQMRLWKRRNKMSKDEVKREHRDREGDPQVKAIRKSLQRDMR
jgi:flagellar biosynthesis protein FlhB